ncbi:MAG: ABC transporter substrate-binding protein, partial [Anaerolineaceae bacterium]|nr:ABC transporter substrate-binding protein [Anaerolineaceae bacterium]
ISNFVSIEALDDYTVKLTLANPDAVLFSPGRGITSGCIIPQEAVEQLGEDWGLHPIGGGPFEFVEYVPDDHATLVRNEDFVIQPYLDEVIFKVIPDDDVRMIALEAREIHFTSLPETEFDRFYGDPDYILYSGNCIYSFNLQFDVTHELFTDIKVREAIGHAVDGRAIMKNQFGGMFVEGCGIAGPAVPGHDPDMCDKYFTYDPELTVQLMTDAGWEKNSDGIWEKDGQTFTFEFEIWNLDPAPVISTAAVTQMQTEGFDVTLLEVEFGTWIEDALGGNVKPMMMWSGFCGDGGMISYWGREGLATNWGFADEEVWSLLDESNMIMDVDERQAALVKAHDAIYATYADIPLGFATGYMITLNNVEDFEAPVWTNNIITTTNNTWLSGE